MRWARGGWPLESLGLQYRIGTGYYSITSGFNQVEVLQRTFFPERKARAMLEERTDNIQYNTPAVRRKVTDVV